VDKTTDGVVAYRSAHLDGVLSETVVRSDHGVQKNPKAVLEVRRILLEHVGALPAAPGVQQAQFPSDPVTDSTLDKPAS
jgi:hypothetical protein